jgi:ADP-ribose pyrophosphatase YjhB (NUDIX family)
MKFCSSCGKPVTQRIPANDERLRFVCDHCDIVHYQNPRVVVGCLPLHGDSVLLCKRAIDPRSGYWTLPAGFLENGETTLAGAKRETMEEACARVRGESLYTLFDLPHINQVYFFYRAELVEGVFGVGEESLDVRLFTEKEIPWTEIAFPVVTDTLQHYFADRRTGEFPVRQMTLDASRKLNTND